MIYIIAVSYCMPLCTSLTNDGYSLMTVFADAIEAVSGSDTQILSSGAGCRGMDLSTTEAIVQAIAEEYDGLRRDDALAAVDLTYGGIGGTKVRGVPHSSVMFKVQMMIFMVLNKITVGLVPMPAMLRILKGDSARYSTLKMANKVEKHIAYVTVIGIIVGVGLALM